MKVHHNARVLVLNAHCINPFIAVLLIKFFILNMSLCAKSMKRKVIPNSHKDLAEKIS